MVLSGLLRCYRISFSRPRYFLLASLAKERPMPSRDFKRTDRVGAELRRELAVLVHAAVRDYGLPSVSVSDVEVTRDLDYASVWVTALLPDQSVAAVKALNEIAGEFRKALSRQMRLRRVPELRFKYDDSVDKGERIEHLLRRDSPDPISDNSDD
jgi:ribosome-binding factor A